MGEDDTMEFEEPVQELDQGFTDKQEAELKRFARREETPTQMTAVVPPAPAKPSIANAKPAFPKRYGKPARPANAPAPVAEQWNTKVEQQRTNVGPVPTPISKAEPATKTATVLGWARKQAYVSTRMRHFELARQVYGELWKRCLADNLDLKEVLNGLVQIENTVQEEESAPAGK